MLYALVASAEVREREGEEFELSLHVSVPVLDFAWMTLRVTRPPLDAVGAGAVYTHPNGDTVFEASARLEPGGESFLISVEIPILKPDENGARVRLAPEFSDIANRYIERKDRLDPSEP